MIAGKRKTIGVFLCKAYTVFDNAVYHALEEEAHRLNYDVIIFTTVGFFSSQNEYDSQERGMFSFAPIEQLDGIIVAPDTYEIEGFRDQLYEELKRRAKCPVVSIRHQEDDYDCVYTDENLAIRPLMKHLLEDHGLKRIAFLAGYEGHPDGEKRLQVYKEEMAAHGLTVDEEKDIAHGTMWINCGDMAYEAFFSDPERRPEAVVCANDFMAIGLMRTLRKNGIRIPEDVIVTGFDNVQNYALNEPMLTTVEQNFEEMASKAMEELDRQIRGEYGENEKKTIKRIAIGGQLILGESCGCGGRGEDFYVRTSMERAELVDSMNSREVSMTYLTIELNACDDLKDLHRVLVNKMDDTRMVRDYYLCLFEKGKDGYGEPVFAEEQTDQACLVHVMRDRQDHGMPMITFDRCKLLPEMAERADEPQVLYLVLLHQREKAYGYALFHYQPGEVPTNFFQHWNIILSGALSNMHKRDELKMLYEERRLSSITDVMTRLLNRRGLEEQLSPIWQRLCARGESAAFISFDMDRLKQINDTYGHQAGDYAIRLTGDAIRRAAPKDAILARMGGDEFLAVMPRADDQSAKRFMRDFQKQLKALNKQEDRAFNVEASCGAVVIHMNGLSTIEECIQRSDEELYRQKEKRHTERYE
ncbi:MAG: GGDEF domain-containing protein [Clostridia bacterium]|nr:GGDEF domain-containing protein [Clostridia bacterium]